MGNEEKVATMSVIKRNNRKVPFDGSKIAIAIKKGFDSIVDYSDDQLKRKYGSKDIDKIYHGVIEKIAKQYEKNARVKIEDIQDLIEDELKEKKYHDVYQSFSEYRERRGQSRKLFFDQKKQHKFLKVIENLGLKSSMENDEKRENANVDGDTAMGKMLQYGSTISKEFAKSYLLKRKFSDAHDDGDIHIHDLDFLPMGTTTCTQINIAKLFKGGFSTGHGTLREPNDIMSYGALTAIAIQANQNDQHGGQSVPAFDYYLAPGVVRTFRKQFKQTLFDLLEYSDFLSFVNFDKITNKINKLNTMEIDITEFSNFYGTNETMKKVFFSSCEKAIAKTERIVYQAMEGFVHNLNTMHSRAGAQVPFSSVNFGTDTSREGRLVVEKYLKAVESGLGRGETAIFPISIFKVKEGVNYHPQDPNYDLFELACAVSAKRLFPNFAFLDAPFNLEFYNPDNFDTEVAYMGCRTRVMGNVVDEKKAITPGRGNLSFTTINLPRIAIKHGIINNEKANFTAFYQELEEKMELVKNQLLDRFAIQCGKRVYNFPFVMGQGNWVDSEKLERDDNLRKTLKHGSLSIGFIGLTETLVALIGKHHGEDEKAQKLGFEIISFMRNKIDQFAEKHRLNFTLLASPAEGLASRFTNLDRAIFGKIKGITDKAYYTNSFHIPVNYKISIENKIKKESIYHELTNAGHITYIELEGNPAKNLDGFMKIVKTMKEAGIGYGAINHPLDRDAVCGFSGIINDYCPGCGRFEEDIPFERIRRITGYLVGTLERFNDGKKAEEKDRVKHGKN